MWQPLGHTPNQHQTHWTVTLVLKLGFTTFCLSSFWKITAPRVQTLTGQRRSEPQAIAPQLGWRRKRFNKKTLANLCHLPSRKGLHHKSLDFVGPSLLWHPQHGVFEDLQDNLLPLMVQNNRILGVSSLVPRSSESRRYKVGCSTQIPTKFVTLFSCLPGHRQQWMGGGDVVIFGWSKVRAYLKVKAPFEHSLLKQAILKHLGSCSLDSGPWGCCV